MRPSEAKCLSKDDMEFAEKACKISIACSARNKDNYAILELSLSGLVSSNT